MQLDLVYSPSFFSSVSSSPKYLNVCPQLYVFKLRISSAEFFSSTFYPELSTCILELQCVFYSMYILSPMYFSLVHTFVPSPNSNCMCHKFRVFKPIVCYLHVRHSRMSKFLISQHHNPRLCAFHLHVFLAPNILAAPGPKYRYWSTVYPRSMWSSFMCPQPHVFNRRTWPEARCPARRMLVNAREWRNNASWSSVAYTTSGSKARSNARWPGRSLAFKTRWRMCFSYKSFTFICFHTNFSSFSFVDRQNVYSCKSDLFAN